MKMTGQYVFLVLLIAFSYWLTGCFNEPRTTNKNESSLSNESESASTEDSAIQLLTLTATIPDRLILDEPWPLTATLSNNSKDPVTIWRLKDQRSQVLVKIWDAEGERLERNEYGRQHLHGDIISASATSEVLEPGKTFTWPKIALGQCFDFAPGQYTVELAVSVQQVGKVRHEFTFTVLPPVK